MTATTPDHASSDSMGGVARVLDQIIAWYQHAVAGRISPCRYVPSCSTYAREALDAHGAVRGTSYALLRLCRCHPWGGHGYDPVPGTESPVPGTDDTDLSRTP